MLAPLRAENSLLTLDFLANGGTVQVVSHIEHAPYRSTSYNNRHRIGCKSKSRKERIEFETLERQIAEHGRALAGVGLSVAEACRQLRPRWAGQLKVSAPIAEQIAAKYGYAYVEKGSKK